jgi:hypothetical protein
VELESQKVLPKRSVIISSREGTGHVEAVVRAHISKQPGCFTSSRRGHDIPNFAIFRASLQRAVERFCWKVQFSVKAKVFHGNASRKGTCFFGVLCGSNRAKAVQSEPSHCTIARFALNGNASRSEESKSSNPRRSSVR